MRTFVSAAVGAAVLVLGTMSARSHHSAAMFDRDKVVTLTGIVQEFEYVNPHSWLYVLVADDKGTETLWGFEAEGPSTLMRAGIKKNSLRPGDKVTVQAHPLRDGRPAGAWLTVIKADGTALIPRPGAIPAAAPAP